MAEDTPTGPSKAYEDVIMWLWNERFYTLEKFGVESDITHIEEWSAREHPMDSVWWTRQLETYYHRAYVLGLDTPVGRQALAKFVATAAGMLAATVQVYGELPAAGVPSGEIE